jgi:hypothetical protein
MSGITGIQPAIAQTVVGLGVELAGIRTLGSLRDGLKFCMARTHGRWAVFRTVGSSLIQSGDGTPTARLT